METINNIELRDENHYPDEHLLRQVLGASHESYERLLNLFAQHELVHQWRYYRDGKAWLCKVQKKNRTIVWMSAWPGYMQATVYFPEKHLEKVYELPLSVEVINRINATKNVGKSKPCIFEIRDVSALDDFSQVMQLKIVCK